MVASIWRPACGSENFFVDDFQTNLVQCAASARNISIKSIASPTFSLTHYGITHHFVRHRPDTLSFFSRQVTNSKALTKAFLRQAGIPTPNGRLFDPEQLEEAWEYARKLESAVVVKPLTGSSGKGVTANIRDWDHFCLAWKQVPEGQRVIIEEHIEGQDYRVVVIGKSHAGTALRRPARIIGDGRSTISQLIDQKRSERSQNPFVADADFELTSNMAFLLRCAGFDENTLLPKGRTWQLHDIANISAGGDTIDVSTAIHPDFQDIAVRATYAVPGLRYSGVDLLVPDISKPAAGQKFAVIEVNSTPDLALHHYPMEGSSRDLNGALLEDMFPTARIVPPAQWVGKTMTVEFDGNFDRFTEDLKLHVFQNCAAGSLTRTGDRTGMIEVAAPSHSCARFVRRVRSMPGTKVDVSPWDGAPPPRFVFSA